MATKKKSSSTSSLVITFVAVLLAIAAVIFVIITFSGNNGNNNPPASTDAPTVNVNVPEEVMIGAHDLLQKNYKVYQYFTYGMTVKKEPYDNKPEDGFYTCENDSFENFDKFSDYVKSIYTDDVAQKLLTDPFGNGPVYGNDNGALGLSADFVASTEKGNSWADANYVCTAVSETEYDIALILKDSSGNDVNKNVKMVETADGWRLDAMVG